MRLVTTLEERFGADFEKTFCRLIVSDPTFAEVISEAITEDLFHSAPSREIISTYCYLREKKQGVVPGIKSVRTELFTRYDAAEAKKSPRAGILEQALRRLDAFRRAEYPEQVDVDYIRENLVTFITHRNTHLALIDSVDLLESGEYDEIQKRIADATQSGKLRVQPSLGLEFTNADAKFAAYSKKYNSRVRAATGIPLLDSAMRGGAEAGTVTIIMAPPGVGKTLVMVNYGVTALLDGLNVVHVTLEINAVDTALRYDARFTGCPINTILKNVAQYETRIRTATEKLRAKLFIREWGSIEASVYELRAYLKTLELRKKFRPDLIIVDYADLLRPHRALRERRWELSETLRGLRQLACEYECPVITGSQVNKDGFDAEVLSMRHIAEASDKAAIADIILGLCQTYYERRRGRLRALIIKNRQGGREGRMVDCTLRTDTQTLQQNPIQTSDLQQGNKPDDAKRKGRRDDGGGWDRRP